MVAVAEPDERPRRSGERARRGKLAAVNRWGQGILHLKNVQNAKNAKNAKNAIVEN